MRNIHTSYLHANQIHTRYYIRTTLNLYLNFSNPQNRRHRTVQWTDKTVQPKDPSRPLSNSVEGAREMARNGEATVARGRRLEYEEGQSERWTSNCSGELIRVGCGCCVRSCPRVQEGAHRPLSIAGSGSASFPSLSSRSHPLTSSRALLSLSLSLTLPCRFLHRMILILSSRASRTGSLNGPLQFALRPTAHSRRIN